MNTAYAAQAYGCQTSSDHHYSRMESDRPRYDYDERDRDWRSSQRPGTQSGTVSAHTGTGSTTAIASPSSYPQASRYARAQSPGGDIQPPSWYQNYAHSVAPKAHYSQGDSSYYGSHDQRRSQESWPAETTGSGIYPLVHDKVLASNNPNNADDSMGHGDSGSSGRSSSKRQAKTSLEASQSVHPFDTSMAPTTSKSKKIKRIKSGPDEDVIFLDNEFYAVKAKRKRANA
ncbi:hypothetical protein BGW38_009453, partial [Lunasporangiospora selenospora]